MPKKIILSGGGTGGHIYPAVAVAEALKRRLGDDVDLLFVGAEGKMEMEKVPALGYRIVGLPIAGLQRRLEPKNLLVPFKVLRSIRLARRTIRDFGADVVAGFGGYASAPVLWAAQRMGVPTLIQEQNSYAGVTNKHLGKKAGCICVAYDNMERFFPADRIVMTGNPVREAITACTVDKAEAKRQLGFDPEKPLVAVVGGSLGARTVNEAVKASMDRITAAGAQILWQTGKYYADSCIPAAEGKEGVQAMAFVSRMDLVYRAADLIVSRAGASTISELQIAGTPAVLIPSPNVAEDHQRKNAQALADRDAAVMILDADATASLADTVTSLLADKERLASLGKNVRAMAQEHSDERIVDHIYALCDKG